MDYRHLVRDLCLQGSSPETQTDLERAMRLLCQGLGPPKAMLKESICNLRVSGSHASLIFPPLSRARAPLRWLS